MNSSDASPIAAPAISAKEGDSVRFGFENT
jgi:hypothetical protein